jgi:taurine dioxygenase
VTTGTRTITVTPLAPALGAEVVGVDVARASERDVIAVRDAVLRHAVVVLRDQSRRPEDQLAFTERLWPLRPSTSLNQMAPPGFPQMTVISNIVEDGRPVGLSDAGLLWHTDTCFTSAPELFVSLSAKVIPTRPGASLGDTIWISTAAAYEALSSEQQRRLAGLRAVQSYPFHLEKMARLGLLTRGPTTDEQRAQFPVVDHPVVRTHPITGRKLLYVNESFSAAILGMDADAGQALLEELWAHLLRPELAFRHRWRTGDLVIWDNAATQHHATFDYGDAPRLLHRLGTGGPVPE